jgi:hypothetical protein
MNYGLDATEEVIVRNCPLFRWDQSVLNAHFARAIPDPEIADIYKFAGWQSPRDHPEQMLWSHRRRGDYRYLWRVPYTWRAAAFALPFTLWFRARWRYRQNAWLFRPRTYVDKLRRMAGRTA